jgi:hypothetical protein
MKSHTLFILAALVVVPACKGSSSDDKGSSAQKTATTTEANASDALVESLSFGTVSWTVRPDGSIAASIKADDGAKTTGQVSWREGDGEKSAPLTDDTRGGLAASGPKLTDDVTQIRYTLQHGDAPYEDVLQVPPGGTAQLASDAKASVAVDANATGPHGGAVQAVGDDRIEVVVDGSDVKAWLLDAKLQPMTASIEGRTITIAAANETPQTVSLTFDANLGVYVGKWTMDDDPRRLTIVVKKNGVVHATLAGYKPGVALACGAKAPRIKVHVHIGGGPKDGDGDGVVDVKMKIKDKDKDKGESVKIDVKEKDGDKDKDKGKAKGKDDDDAQGNEGNGKGKKGKDK